MTIQDRNLIMNFRGISLLPFIEPIAFSACHWSWTPNWHRPWPMKKFWSFSPDFDNINLFLPKTNTPRRFWAFRRQRNFVRHRNCTITNAISIHFRYSLSIEILSQKSPESFLRCNITYLLADSYWCHSKLDMLSFKTTKSLVFLIKR